MTPHKNKTLLFKYQIMWDVKQLHEHCKLWFDPDLSMHLKDSDSEIHAVREMLKEQWELYRAFHCSQ